MGYALSVRLRALCVLTGAGSAAITVAFYAATPAVDLSRRLMVDGPHSLTAVRFDKAIIVLCSVSMALCCVWMVLVTALLVAEAIISAAGVDSPSTRRIPRVTARVCPRLAQRIVLAGCGVALTAGLGSPATADQVGQLGGLAVPDRTIGPPHGDPQQARVTITAGASLWSIAASALPHDAGDAEITSAWHALHRANARLIGDDPDLIFPGTTLQIPDLREPDRKDHL